MGLCKCPKRKVTNLFCFVHRVNVCEHCIVDGHARVWNSLCGLLLPTSVTTTFQLIVCSQVLSTMAPGQWLWLRLRAVRKVSHWGWSCETRLSRWRNFVAMLFGAWTNCCQYQRIFFLSKTYSTCTVWMSMFFHCHQRQIPPTLNVHSARYLIRKGTNIQCVLSTVDLAQRIC